MMQLKEMIVVEGRDDERAVKSALDADTIATHGFGISQGTWQLIEKAYESRGIIIFTDPDFAGEKIRKRLKGRFPQAKEAFLDRKSATKKDNIGIENASKEAILKALEKAGTRKESQGCEFTKDDLVRYDLVGTPDATDRRDRLGGVLGIGYGNSSAFLKKLNAYGVSKDEFEREAEKL